MLTKFTVKNFRGFRDKIEWDLSRPSSYEFNSYAVKEGVIKNGIVYGPNGCGKTNFSLSVFDIVNHLTQKFKLPDYYRNFVYTGTPDKLVEFEYSFRFGQSKLEYAYAKNYEGKLINESLYVDGKLVFEHRDRILTIDNVEFPMEAKFKEDLAANANHVSIVNVLMTSFPLKPGHYLLELLKFVNGMLWFRNVDRREFIGLETGVYDLDEYIIKNGLVDDFQKFLKRISGQDFVFVKHDKNDKKLLCEYGDHTIAFDNIASTGTDGLMLLYFWVKKLNEASFVFVDEFDAFYHFDLAFEVCKLLFGLDCQVFTTSHNTYLMTNDLLRPDCNFILNHNVIKPLCDCTDKELRFGHNVEKLYRGGTFQV